MSPRAVASVAKLDSESHSGHGLQIVDVLSVRWGVDECATHVWAEPSIQDNLEQTASLPITG